MPLWLSQRPIVYIAGPCCATARLNSSGQQAVTSRPDYSRWTEGGYTLYYGTGRTSDFSNMSRGSAAATSH